MLFLHSNFNPAFKSLGSGDTLDALWLRLYKSRCAVTYLHCPHPALSHASTEPHEWRRECGSSSLRRISRLCRELRAKLRPHLCSQVVFPVFRCVHVPWPGDWRLCRHTLPLKSSKINRINLNHLIPGPMSWCGKCVLSSRAAVIPVLFTDSWITSVSRKRFHEET